LGRKGGFMPVKSKIDKSRDLTTYILEGEISADDLMNALKSFFDGKPTANVLWDLRETKVEKGMTSEDLEEMAKYSKTRQPLKPRGKIVIVASSDLTFGLSRTFETFAEMKGVKNPVKVFRSMGKALKWLDEE
jgi:hypothetical protein